MRCANSVRGLGLAATCLASLAAVPAAHAFNGPAQIKIDGGPFGTLQLSGGATGFAWAQTGTGSMDGTSSLDGTHPGGITLMTGMVEVQKTDGLVQGTLILGAANSFTLGVAPGKPSITTFSTGPAYNAYLTLAPSPNFNISAGHVGSLEGYESGLDWNNFNVLTTDIFYVENSQSTGVSATATFGPVAGTITFGDGFDTQVWNYLQLSATYTINDSNNVTLYGATNLGTTGLGAKFYGSASQPYSSALTTVGNAGAANLVNSSMVGGYYNFTAGNLNIVPEAQYVWAKADPALGLSRDSGNLGLAVFANYQFGKSPYSLGGWVEYFASNGPDSWFLNPESKGFGVSVTPTWQGKYLFVRGDVGLLHLTSLGVPGSIGYGSSLNGRNVGTFLVETGVLF